MRITSAFISTLLSASTVLAKEAYPFPYAGFRVAVDQAHPVNFITATFKVPPINCRAGDIAYVGVAIGDPLTCGGGIEAGVVLKCGYGRIVYRPYWRSYPDIAYFSPNEKIAQGEEIQVQIQVVDRRPGNVKVTIKSVTKGWTLSPVPLDTVGYQCQFTASWILRADLENSVFKSIPSFDPFLLYALDATDVTKNSHSTQKAHQLTMTDSKNHMVANAERDHHANEPHRTIRIFQ